MALCLLAEQLAIDPAQRPQVQVQGPEPLTTEAEPALQRLEDGAEVNAPPLDEPQTPGLDNRVAVQVPELVPPPEPLQVQVQGPEPDTAVAVPVLQRLVVGAVQTELPLAEPQVPLTTGLAQVVDIVLSVVLAPPAESMAIIVMEWLATEKPPMVQLKPWLPVMLKAVLTSDLRTLVAHCPL